MFTIKNRAWLCIVILGLFAFPQYAQANAGTPLMWAGIFHLFIGNALIGLFEGSLLYWIFRVSRAKAVGVMILANYFSAWLGGVFIDSMIVRASHMDLNNGSRWFWIMVGVTYILTLFLEWPFVAWVFRGTSQWLKHSLRASLLIQSSSYVLLFSWYWMATVTSLYTEAVVVTPENLSLPESVLIYYIAPKDGNVYKKSLAGKDVENMIFKLHSSDDNDRLFVQPSAVDTNRWDLMARLETADRRKPRIVAVITNMLVEATLDWRSTYTNPSEHPGTWFNFGRVQGIGSGTNSLWIFRTGFWASQGLRGANESNKESLHIAYETPFGAWMIRNAVVLPTDKVLFQLDHDQICCFDPAGRRVALLWRGRGPVAVIPKQTAGHGED